jgi:hypothetical protein
LDREAVDMPNDAKLGMIVGVGVVIAIAVVFFRKDAAPAPPAPNAAAAAAIVPSVPPAAPTYRNVSRKVTAQTAIRSEAAPAAGQRPTALIEPFRGQERPGEGVTGQGQSRHQ